MHTFSHDGIFGPCFIGWGRTPFTCHSIFFHYSGYPAHRVYKVPGNLYSRPNWVPQSPHPQASVVPKGSGSKGETHPLSWEEGWGPNSEEGTLWYYIYTTISLRPAPSTRTSAKLARCSYLYSSISPISPSLCMEPTRVPDN
jgi:hypothetical protein